MKGIPNWGAFLFCPKMPSIIHIIAQPIEDTGLHLLIEAKVNGKSATLLIDTGASQTVFDLNRINRYSDSEHTISDTLSTGLGTNSMESRQMKLENIILGDIEINDLEVILLDLSHVNGRYLNMNLKPIDGVLGGDILLKHKAVIDYGEMELRLH